VPLPLGSLLLRQLASFRESLQVVTSPCCPRQLPDVISESLSLDAGSPTPAVHRVLSPVSSTASSAFPRKSWVGVRVCPATYDFSQRSFRGCRYFVMFRPPSLLAPQVVPTAANTPAGQPGLLRPGTSCFVASARTGYANRPNTGNWRCRDSHPARLRSCRLLLSVRPPCYPGRSHLASPVGDHDYPCAIFPYSLWLKRSLPYAPCATGLPRSSIAAC
jgi:hypothetical protein